MIDLMLSYHPAKVKSRVFQGLPLCLMGINGNLVFICCKLSATKMTPDQFIDSSIESSWYADGNLHTMYVGEILEVLAR